MNTATMLREWSTPPEAVVPDGVNASDDVFGNASRCPDHVAFLRKASGRWHPVTAKQFADEVTALAAGLIASGIRPGERIALMSATCYEWALCDFAILAAGAVTVPIYETSSAEQVAWILRDSDAVAAFVEDDALAAVVDAAGVSSVRHRWNIERGGLEPLVSAGASVPAEQVRQRRHVGTDGLASIVYTSGTTGRARGCMISHRSLVAEVRNVAGAEGVDESVLTDRATILLSLPLAHILARVCSSPRSATAPGSRTPAPSGSSSRNFATCGPPSCSPCPGCSRSCTTQPCTPRSPRDTAGSSGPPTPPRPPTARHWTPAGPAGGCGPGGGCSTGWCTRGCAPRWAAT
jgi:long-subunit acyl-CoA synthetase (AMP-forming)